MGIRFALLIAVAIAMEPSRDGFAGTAAGAAPENLARRAAVSASSEYNESYRARFAVDGVVPYAGSHADAGRAWCVHKSESGDAATFTLQWPAPIEAGAVVYWGRTGWFPEECWKDYEIYLDDARQPTAKGTFQKRHGPQRVSLGRKTRLAKMVLKFLNSYGGPNPGASEIQVFADSPSDRQLAESVTVPHTDFDPPPMPWVGKVDPAKLRALILDLAGRYGSGYPQAAEHLARLARLEKLRQSPAAGTRAGSAGGADAKGRGGEIAAELDRLQREALLFDVGRLVIVKRYEIAASHVYTYHYEGFRAGGGLYCVKFGQPKPEFRELVPAARGQILDCDLSYDARVIVFSWRRQENQPYHVWAIHVDGSGLRQLTDGPWHDYNPCWLPDGGIAFLSTRRPQFAYCWHAPVGVLHRMRADGSGVQRLSGNYLNDFTPAVLDDGRILYTRWEYVDRPAIPIQSLWAINPDGTGLAGFFGNRKISPGTFMEGRSIPGTGQILCTMTGHNGPTRGAIGMIDRSRGVNAQEAIRNLTPDVPVPRVVEGNGNTSGSKQYSGPYPLDAGRFLCLARGPVLVRTLAGECQSLALPAPDDGMQYFSPRSVRPRKRPPVIPSRLPEKPEPYGVVYLQDVYNGLASHVAAGEVKAIRVVRELPKTVRTDPKLRAFGFQFPVISCGATYAGKEVLGEVPVESDGSACFKVPAGVPIYFMALDRDGRAVQRMRSFTHLMPGEVQGCIGCHERRLDTSRPRPGRGYNRQPCDLTPPEWGPGGFDYSRIVQPVLDRYCVRCHDAVEPSDRVDLSGGKTDYFNVSYEVLARENQGRRGSPFVSWIPTYNGQEWNVFEITPKEWGSPQSKLAGLILSGHRDHEGTPRFCMDEQSRRRVLAWIDLNVPYYGSSETAYPEKLGCRRLYPANLDAVLADVGRRRCAACHSQGQFPRRVWTRITEPELNAFLVAPLACEAGGSEKCGRSVFADRSDPDYQAILATFQPIRKMLAERPRMDMPGGKPSYCVSRSCQ